MQDKVEEVQSLMTEGERVMNICNACRYCEGFCAVFPAMERRLSFANGDLRYLANLCHDCRECYYACQYAPPHEFKINVPKVLTRIRRQSYQEYAWPAGLARFFTQPVFMMILSMLIIPLIFIGAGIFDKGVDGLLQAYTDAQGSFYQIMSHTVMTGVFGVVGLYVLVAFIIGWINFSRDMHPDDVPSSGWAEVKQALKDILTLRYLGSSGDGCAYPDANQSLMRRNFHHFTFYGFMLCFAATSVATIYHYVLNYPAPYPLLSLPVILGTLGGIGLIIGPCGLLYLKKIQDKKPSDEIQSSADTTLLLILLLISITGLLLMVLRETSWMGFLLLVHLGLVMGLFLSMPYGKFVHGIYRFGALLRFTSEGRKS
ncbi:MAG: tricarballylate utilization 4Fe-4S protein TcuB [Gammaproteobacteria bacterium]|nr:tricarballylate utilization 4Fe-4S protein TcuB [Gammaproteobacteria bacterium]